MKLLILFILPATLLLSCNKDDEVNPFSENEYGTLEVEFEGEQIKVEYIYLGSTSEISETSNSYYDVRLYFDVPSSKDLLDNIALGKKPVESGNEEDLDLGLKIYGTEGDTWESIPSQDLTKYYNNLESMKLIEASSQGNVYEYKGSFAIEMRRVDGDEDEIKIANGTYHIRFDSYRVEF